MSILGIIAGKLTADQWLAGFTAATSLGWLAALHLVGLTGRRRVKGAR